MTVICFIIAGCIGAVEMIVILAVETLNRSYKLMLGLLEGFIKSATLCKSNKTGHLCR